MSTPKLEATRKCAGASDPGKSVDVARGDSRVCGFKNRNQPRVHRKERGIGISFSLSGFLGCNLPDTGGSPQGESYLRCWHGLALAVGCVRYGFRANHGNGLP